MYDQNPLLHKLSIDALARPYQTARSPRGPVRGAGRPSSLIALAVTAVTAVTLGVYGATAMKAGAAKTGRPIPHPAIAEVRAPADLDLATGDMVCSELAEHRVPNTAKAVACSQM